MTDEAISPLRRRMIEDMTVRHFAEKTQKDYIRHVKNFTASSAARRTRPRAEDLRRFQLHLTDDRRERAEHQRAVFGAAVLLHRDARREPTGHRAV